MLKDYIVVRNFIEPNKANELGSDFEAFCEENKVGGDIQSPASRSVVNYIPFLQLLVEKTANVSELVGEKVLPTYAYARVYEQGADLKAHTDRDSCELSLTVHLRGDQPWDFWIKTSNGKDIAVSLNPGDAIIYQGCKLTHWRNPYNGNFYTQVFLHYVYSEGDRVDFFFDSDKKPNSYEKRKPVESAKSLTDYILVIKKLIPSEVCDGILRHLPPDSPHWTIGTIGGYGETDDTLRRCHSVTLTGQDEFKKLDDVMFSFAGNAFTTYQNAHNRICATTDTGYQALKYETGGYYVEHTDSFNLGQRELTCSFMLNDDYEGGEFAFFGREIKYKLDKGDAILFPANFMFPHEIMPVTSGTRYAIITWYV